MKTKSAQITAREMKRFLRRSCALALALLLSAGCASEPARAGAASSPATMAPPPPGVTLMSCAVPGALLYEPKSPGETEAVVSLVRDDLEIRPVIEQAQEEALHAVQAYRSAALSRKAPEGGPGVARATLEEMDRLHKAVEEKAARYRGLVQTQRDRYEHFLKKYPDNWFQRHRYAWFLADNHLEDDSAAEWRRVIEQAPAFPYAYNNLGTLYNHMGRDLEAILLYRKAIELYPDDADFHVNLAVNYSTHRAEASKEFGWDLPRVFRECILSYERARALKPKDPEIACDLASQYVLAKFFGVQNAADEAIEAWKYDLALELTPTQRGIADRNLATIYLRQKNDPAAAQKLLEEAQTLMPNDSACKALLEQCRAAETKPAP
jgi:tetratricopeptide (TPR) repeat protein